MESPALINACNALDAFGQALINVIPNESTLLEIWGWNCAPVTREELASLPRRLAERLRELTDRQIDNFLQQLLEALPNRLQLIQNNTFQYISNGNAPGAIPPILSFFMWLSSAVEPYLLPVVDWQDIETQKLMPRALVRRLRSVDTQLDNLEGRSGDLSQSVQVILDAHAAAESLPTDLASLAEARKAVLDTGKAVLKAQKDAHASATEAANSLERIVTHEQEATK